MTGWDRNKPSHLYILKSDGMVKVGITVGKVKYRAARISKKSPEKFEVHCFFVADGDSVQQAERRVLEILRTLYKQPAECFDGSTEAFLCTDLPAVVKLAEEVLTHFQLKASNTTEGEN